MNDILELDIEGTTAQGDGLARVNGQVVFVARALPGERVRAEVVSEKKDFRRAIVRETLAASPLRIAAACPHYEGCGGCQLQHLPYPEQLQHKARGFAETLARVGRIEIAPPPVQSDVAWGYRNRVLFKVPHTGAPRLSLFHFAEPGRYVEIAACPVLHPALEQLIEPVNALLAAWCNPHRPRPGRVLLRRIGEASVMAWIFPAGTRVDHHGLRSMAAEIDGLDGFVVFRTDQWEDGLPAAPTKLILGPREFRVSRGAYWSRAGAENFLQVHDALAERMVAHIVGLNYTCTQRAAEIYCGVGLVAMSLSARFAEVWGLDNDGTAIDHARQASREQALASVQWIAAPAEALSPGVPGFPDKLDAVVFNPPRKGIARRALDAVLARQPLDVVVASCHPATLARDLCALGHAGWHPVEVSLWDLFPQTHHVEAVVHLKQGGGVA